MKTADFDYHLPQDLIAQKPADNRPDSRMMLLDRSSGVVAHSTFREFSSQLRDGDVLVLNDTRVIPARLLGNRPTGAAVELFLLNKLDDGTWRCLVNPGRKVRPGDTITFGKVLEAHIIDRTDEGMRIVEFRHDGDFDTVLEQVGHIPLPPYIHRDHDEAEDRERYQTVFADRAGAVAAPTAGLHFTPAILQEIERTGVPIVKITLHVGLGTFKPVSAEEVEQHRMDAEWFEIDEASAHTINEHKRNGGRVVAVGTTVVRTLESAWDPGTNRVAAGSRWTDIFITPGYSFNVVDALLTNFHLPKSTLIMLVSALAGRENVLAAYGAAVAERYRFYSYGDCMFIS